ncbi:ATP-dependent DNA helicase PIF1 [Phanerochaete sordida]|uniref:ATP-dependent DNA helicase n=1 Tax=Phanerochaete sordida TaxID=48140 RepID=A0A9P3FZ55_9APHY|nr:ATP-dependent DNA helicase PIF1 [Phanerochaete sordida]
MGAVVKEATEVKALVDEVSAPEIWLTEDQEAVLDQFRSGKSVFFTGSAGTGKSLLMRRIIHECHHVRRMKKCEIAVTAPTAMAAMNIDGFTIHSWAGIGIGVGSVDKLLKKVLGAAHSEDIDPQQGSEESRDRATSPKRRWLECRVLIIDEISMLERSLFDKLEEIARIIRHDARPFGGIQLVLSGDFLQLPPIGRDAKFVYRSRCWTRCIEKPMVLKTVFRQKELKFVDYLNQLRMGEVTPEALAFFQRLSRPVTYGDGIRPTELFSTRWEVDVKNAFELEKLPGRTRTFRSVDSPGRDPVTDKMLKGDELTKALERISAPERLELKEGAQVMLLQTLVQNFLVNGSVGTVISYCTGAAALASHYVWFGHSSQMCLLAGRGPRTGKAGERETAEMERLKLDPHLWPVVRFAVGRSKDRTIDVCCVPLLFTAMHATGGVAAHREQVPLMLSYALTIHKAQGQTLERVKVDLKRAFTKGQCYVALSRAVSADALQVLNFDPEKIKADADVIRWLRGLKHQSALDETLAFWDDMVEC